MVRKMVAVAGIAALAAGAAVAQQGRGLPPECREQILRLCGGSGGREAMRQCLRSSMPRLSAPCRTAVSERAAANAVRAEGVAELAYGHDPRHKLDLALPAGSREGGKAPLIVFIHGGGWSIGDKTQASGAKPAHFAGEGWAFASVNYRLVPAASVEQQAADIAGAIAFLRAEGARRGIDPDRVVVMGHSAGAHLAALVASDPTYLAAAGVPFSAIRGAVLLDGAGYDVQRQMTSPGNRVLDAYGAAFGKDPARRARLSPIKHADAPNAPAWLILAVAQRADSTAQSTALAAALRKGGSTVDYVPVRASSHALLNRRLGTPGDQATEEVDNFLRTIR